MKIQNLAIRATAICMMLFATAIANAQPVPNASRTVLLPRGDSGSQTPMNVAFHPGFQQYYASTGGNPGYPAWVYDLSGAIVHSIAPINIDVRALNYNSSTDLMEVVSFNAKAGDSPNYGLVEAVLDGSGFFTGGTVNLLASMPGNIDSQTMPAYDPVNNVFYSRSSGNTVNVVSRLDGSLLDTIVLDTATAGSGTLTVNPIGYSPEDEWLIVVDYVNDDAVVFDLNGDWVGTSALDIDAASNYRFGFTNGQLFVFDGAQNGWQGFDIGAALPVDDTRLRFRVTKTFTDLNEAEVEVTLTCNGGLPLQQSFTIASGDPAGVTFVVTNTENGVDCEVTESGGPSGYTPIMNGGAGCAWTDVTGGLYSCAIENQALPATFTVNKEWIISENGGGDDVDRIAEVVITCNMPILNGDEQPGDVRVAVPLNGYLEYTKTGTIVGDGELEAIVDTSTGSAMCSAEEILEQTGVETTDNCGLRTIDAGGTSECTITNTVFFEGIPSLNQYGLAIMALLMLGMGMVGFRRFA